MGMMNVAEVAEELGVCCKTVQRLCQGNRIEHTKVGQQYRFERAWVEAFKEGKRRCPVAPKVRGLLAC
jgi:excisionase family DNA binding protein